MKLVRPFGGQYLLVGKVFVKAFRILGLDERKDRWVVEQDFLPFSLASLTAELCSFWYGLKDLFTLHKLADNVFFDH